MKDSRGLTRKLSPFALRLNWSLVLTLILLQLVSVGRASTPVAQSGTTCDPDKYICVNGPPDDSGDVIKDVKRNDGFCSLREAIIAANSDKRSGTKDGECSAGSGDDTIILAADPDPSGIARYALSLSDNGKEDSASTGDLDILDDVIIEGAGSRVTIIDSSEITDRAFQILGGDVTIKGVTITKSGNTVAGDGGGIHNSTNLTLVESTLSDNHTAASGGGIYNEGVLTLFDSTISINTANDSGGGIANASMGSVALNNSTVSGNTATNDGGGIFNMGLLPLHNATIADNRANNGGGVVNSDASGTVNFRNTIIAGNTATSAPDCSGTLSSLGYNLIQDPSSCTISGDTTGNIAGQALLGLLQDNGGQTETHALLPASPAIDAGNPSGCFGSEGLFPFDHDHNLFPFDHDQRGEPRPTDGDSNGSFICDIGAYEVGRNLLVLLRAFPNVDNEGNPVTTVHGLLDGTTEGITFEIVPFSKFSCEDPSSTMLDPIPVTAIENGYFITEIPEDLSGLFLIANTNHPDSGPMQSNCVPVSERNDSWPFADELILQPEGQSPRSADVDDQFIDGPGQSRWFKLKVEPHSELTVILSGVNPDNPDDTDFPLPADFNLTLYRDLDALFKEITAEPTSDDVVRLSAQYAGASYAGASYAGASYAGASYAGASYAGPSYAGASYAGASYAGASYAGASYAGASYAGASYAGDAYFGASYAGASYAGASYAGASYAGASYAEAVFGGASYAQAYSDAQIRGLLAVSDISGTAPERIVAPTWNRDEFWYIRVRSSNGEATTEFPFRLEAILETGGCGGIQPLPDSDPLAPGHNGTNPNPTTLILYDSSRLNRIEGSDQINIVAQLNSLADDDFVDGLALDVHSDSRVEFANIQADADDDGDGVPDLVGCPLAKNLVAQAIQDVVDGYRTQDNSNLQYVVIVGADAVIPFFRHPDLSALANEDQYFPPLNLSPSEASLRLSYVLSDDDYVAKEEIELSNSTFPIIDSKVAIGRLVETASDISAVIDAYLNHTNNGVVQPQTSLATGYDFLEDTANEIRDQLAAGTNNTPDTLIHPFALPPTDESAWTADQLRAKLLGSRHDLVFLAGHFSGNSALAADYTTEMLAEEVANSSVDMRNGVIFSIGCHAGYNIVNQDGVPNVTGQPDWAQAFASKGAALIAGTGYQYGETLTKEYSERLYTEFSKRLRLEGGPISIGHALNAAKLAYITQVPTIRGTHEKVLLEATVFGLPMLSVDLPGRFTPPPDQTVINPADLTGFPEPGPGFELGLQYADLTVNSPLIVHSVELTDVDTGIELPGEFLSGTDGEVTFPTEPFLPLESRNVTHPDNATLPESEAMVLRGVGFRGGNYEDIFNRLPVTGAPTTEAIALHLSWQTEYHHPIRMNNSNYPGALIDGQQRVLFTPAQHIAGDTLVFVDPGDSNNMVSVRMSHRRQFSQLNYRLFYSNFTEEFCEDGTCHNPAFSSPPSIIRVSAIPGDDDVTYRMTVVGDPSAGMQAVWVVWTIDTGEAGSGTWQPFDLTQREEDTRIWEGTMPLNGVDPDTIRYAVFAVNGFGLVSEAWNNGNFFTPGPDAEPNVVTEVHLEVADGDSGVFEEEVVFSAVLTGKNGQPLPPDERAGHTIEFKLGGLNVLGTTDSAGRATVTLNLLGLPGDQKLYAAFDGTDTLMASSDVKDFTIEQQQPQILDLGDVVVLPGQDSGVVITLVDGLGDPLREHGVLLVLTDPTDPTNTPLFSVAGITNLFGEVSLGTLPPELAPGDYRVTVYFNDPNNPLGAFVTSKVYKSDSDFATLTLVESPCDTAKAILHDPAEPAPNPYLESIWEPNGKFWTVQVSVNNPDIPAGEVTITIDSVFQDEAVGGEADANFIVGVSDSVELRAERDGNSDGRVYHIFFTAQGGQDFTCTGEVTVPVVDHDQSGKIIEPPVDDGPIYDSTLATKQAPVATDDSANTNEDTAVSGMNVLANDTAAQQNDTLSVTAVNNNQPVGVQITLTSGALLTMQTTGNYDYDPNGQFEALAASDSTTDTFKYTVSDDDSDADIGEVTINITGLNDAPVAIDDPDITTDEDTPVTIDVLANDTDVDGDQLTVSQFTLPASGAELNLNLDGTLTYTPTVVGQDSFTYKASDGSLESNEATVTINVIDVNLAPVANDDPDITTEEDTAVTIAVLANDTDEGNPITDPTVVVITIIAVPANGTVSVDPVLGKVTYTPNTDFYGSDSFQYTVTDEGGLTSNVATVDITLDPVDDPPVANDDSFTTDEETEVTGNVLDNDTNVDGDALTVIQFTEPSTGTLTLLDDGSMSFIPPDDFSGTETFTYEVSDPDHNTDTATVTITISEVNDPPVAVDDFCPRPDCPDSPDPLPQGEPVTIDVLANDTDADDPHDALTVVEFTQGSRGTVTTNDDGTLTYWPNSSFKGTDTFDYTISDGRGGEATAAVTITFGGKNKSGG
jgi:VCBS repeat-containing protein